MTSTVNASTTSGVIVTSDTSGSLALQTANTTALTINTSQNVGIGITPSANQFGNNLQVNQTILNDDNGGTNHLSKNAYYNSGWKYITTDYASKYTQSLGVHSWSTAPSGTAGNTVTWTQAMTLDASGQLGVGTSSPGSKLEVSNTVNTAYDSTNTLTSGQTARLTNLSTTSGVASTLFFKAVGSGGDNSYATISCASLGTGASALTFGVKQTSGYGVVEAMRISPSGQLIINPNGGNSPPAPAVDIYGGSSGTKGALRLGDNTYSAGHVNYWDIGRDNTTTGNFTFSEKGTQKGYIDLTTGAYVAVSDSRLKNNITDITYGLAEVLRFRPVMYNMIEEKENSKKHLGLIAQEVKAVIDEAVDDLIDESQQFYGLDKSGLVPVLVKAIQELSTQLTELKAEVATLKGAQA